MNKLLLNFRKTVLLECIYEWYPTMPLRFYIFPIMLALCLMLSMTHYAQNYAAIIDRSLNVLDKLNITITVLPTAPIQ